MALKPQQQLFLDLLLKDPTRNTKQAALKAGVKEGSAKTTGRRWRDLPEVVAALAAAPPAVPDVSPKKRDTKKPDTKDTRDTKDTKREARPLVGICQLPGWEEEERARGKTGRPTVCTPEIAAEICELIATSDKSLTRICRENDHLPTTSTIYAWLARDADFSELYARAREAQADYLADQMIEIADDDSLDVIHVEDDKGNLREKVNHEHINRSRIRIDTRKWLASKLAPRKYSDKLDLNHGGPANDALATLIQRITQKNEPLLALSETYGHLVVEGEEV